MRNKIKVYITSIYNSKILRYLLSGGVSYLIELTLLIYFTQGLHIWYLCSNLLSSVLSLFVAYLINNFWTFRRKQIRLSRILLLLLIHVCNMAVSTGLLYLFTSLLGFYYVVSKCLATCMSCIWNYYISKHIIYK